MKTEIRSHLNPANVDKQWTSSQNKKKRALSRTSFKKVEISPEKSIHT